MPVSPPFRPSLSSRGDEFQCIVSLRFDHTLRPRRPGVGGRWSRRPLGPLPCIDNIVRVPRVRDTMGCMYSVLAVFS